MPNATQARLVSLEAVYVHVEVQVEVQVQVHILEREAGFALKNAFCDRNYLRDIE